MKSIKSGTYDTDELHHAKDYEYLDRDHLNTILDNDPHILHRLVTEHEPKHGANEPDPEKQYHYRLKNRSGKELT